MKKDYLDKVSALIHNKKAKTEINTELESHILDKIDYYTEIGYDSEQAEEMAVEEMGSPEDTAAPLDLLHSSRKKNIFINVFVTLTMLSSLWIIPMIVRKQNGVHYISLDFISLGVFAFFVLLLYLTRKLRSRKILLPIIILLFGFPIFKPMAYMLSMITVCDVGTYIDSIFEHGYLDERIAVDTLSTVLGVVFLIALIVWAVLDFILINNEIKLKNTLKLRRAVKVVEKIAVAVIAFNLIIMLSCTVLAYNQIDEIHKKSDVVRADMIGYILDADLTLTFDEQLERLEEIGYDMRVDKNFHDQGDRYYCHKGNNQLAIYKGSAGNYNLMYTRPHWEEKFDEIADETKLLDYQCGRRFDKLNDRNIYHAYMFHRFFEEDGTESFDIILRFKNQASLWFSADNGYIKNGLSSDSDFDDYLDIQRDLIELILNDNLTKKYSKSDRQVDEWFEKLEKMDIKPDLISQDGDKETYLYSTLFFDFTVEANRSINDYSMCFESKATYDLAYQLYGFNIDYSSFEGMKTTAFFENYQIYWSKADYVYSSFEYKNGDCIPRLECRLAEYKNLGESEDLKYTTLSFYDGYVEKIENK